MNTEKIKKNVIDTLTIKATDLLRTEADHLRSIGYDETAERVHGRDWNEGDER